MTAGFVCACGHPHVNPDGSGSCSQFTCPCNHWRPPEPTLDAERYQAALAERMYAMTQWVLGQQSETLAKLLIRYDVSLGSLMDESERAQIRLERTNEDRARWRERAKSAEQALGLHGRADA